MIAAILIAVSAVTARPTFELKTLDGKTVTGRVAEADSQRVVLDTDAGRTLVPIDRLLSLSVQPAARSAVVAAPPTTRVTLVDGSVLAAKTYDVQSGTATVVLSSDVKISVPTTAVRHVLLTTAIAACV